MTTILRCDGCKHWDLKEGREQAKAGLCTLAKPLWDCTDWNDDYERVLKPECAGMKMFVQDGSDYIASLFTTADFFCACHERR